MTRHGVTNKRELYGTEDARPEDECFPPTLFSCDNMEVEGNVEEDRQVDVNMFEAGEDVVVGYVGRAEEGARCDDEVESREGRMVVSLEKVVRATAKIKLGVQKKMVVMMTKVMRALGRTKAKMMVKSPALSTGYATPTTAMKKN